MKRLLITLSCALGALTASAQSTPPDDALYRALGGTPGLTKLMDRLRAAAHGRSAHR